MLRKLQRLLRIHPRAWLHGALTYSRFMGRIKPQLLAGSEREVETRLAASAQATEPARLKAPVGRRLVAISPHPDDETIGAGGLLLAHRGQAELSIVTIFNGDGGGQLGEEPWSGEASYKSRLVQARKAELSEVARIMRAQSVHAIDLPDGYSNPTAQDAQRIRAVVEALSPDVVLIPWFLDGLADHRMANLLYASACRDLECMVLGYEVWSLCPPNAFFDTTPWLEEKLKLVSTYRTQTATVDYEGLARGLGLVRGFQLGSATRRTSSAEAFLALPNRDYCDIVRAYYGEPEALSESSMRIFRQAR